ncbi:MAG TPA: LLM class flavin-dependent oxidoreductase, partial [Acidimicrobiales bacterium]|nr:LLM class flavin-dependent oxidoreductase [Acidimicrobiales bacterium]
VMDHFRQIVQVGREWEDFLESWTTLAYLSACTDTVSLGTLVTGITYRNLGHLAKIVSTLDVLSGGRAVCGLGLAWHGEEHAAYGFDFPAVPDRYELLEDALQVLPMLWGPGSPTFKGRRISVPEAMCYPRPLQEHVPILVGGGGERRTLRLAARYADAVNVFGSPEVLAHKVSVLHRHCEEQGRDPGEVLVTHLSTVMVGADDRQVDEKLDRLRPSRSGRQRLASSVNAGTVDDHVGRCRQLAEAGAGEIIVRLADLDTAAAIEPMAAVISSFR